mmetsp:Transcript_6592/g.12146  ORF Transcript_6592/g.12146 Transcript_6592/m.12146 type:complete len:198 (+) Transcript_6592:127-720(+)
MDVLDPSVIGGYLPLAIGSLLAAWGMKKIITKAEKLPNDGYYLPKSLQFEAKKQISIKDKVVVDMLSSHKLLCWVVTDPDMKDNPIVYSSPGFCRYTGYSKIEIEGRNCRFLQGKDTKKEDVDAIRLAIREKREESVCLLNYRKDGTKFYNQFFVMPMFDPRDSQRVIYYLGVQVEVPSKEDGQEPSNPGWVYSLCK